MIAIGPYLSPAERLQGAMLGTTTAILGAVAARLADVTSDMFFMAVCFAPVLVVLLGWRWWSGRHKPPMLRSQRERQYANDAVNMPYSQAVLIQAGPHAVLLIFLVAHFGRTANDFAWLLTMAVLLTYALANVSAYFERREAQRLLQKTL